MKAKEKEKKKYEKKAIKDFVPEFAGKKIREQLPFKKTEISKSDYFCLDEPCVLFPEWSTIKEELQDQTKLFWMTETKIFDDSLGNILNVPACFISDSSEVRWIRPNDYVRERLIEVEIQKNIPGRNPYKLKEKIKEYYNSENNQKISMNESEKSKDTLDEETEAERRQLRKFYRLLQPTTFSLTLVPLIEREETEIEYEIRKKIKEAEDLERDQLNPPKVKSQLQLKKNQTAQDNTLKKLNVHDCNPSKLETKSFHCAFTKWITGVLSSILTNKLKDAYDYKTSIFSRIFPQNGAGMPIVNPSGKYWIGLYHFGALRRVEIDDKIPCNKYNSYILPQCEQLEEIWPAILCKALFKLHSSKYSTQSYSSLNDFSIFYALTGFIPEIINVSSELRNYRMLANILKDSKFYSQQKMILCFHFDKDYHEVAFDTLNATHEKRASKNMGTKKSTNKLYTLSGDSGNKAKKLESTKTFGNPAKKKMSNAHIITPIQAQLQALDLVDTNTFIPNKTKLASLDRLLINYPYSIMDTFDNVYFQNYDDGYNFNLTRLLPPSETSNSKTNNIQKMNLRNMSKEDKVKHIEQIEKNNLQLKQMKKERMDKLDSPGEDFFLVKIDAVINEVNINDLHSIKEPKLSSLEEYNHKDIEIAKKCLLNKWRYPPLSYLEEKVRSEESNSSPHRKRTTTAEIETINTLKDTNRGSTDNLNYTAKNFARKPTMQGKVSRVESKFIASSKEKSKHELYKKPKWTEYYFNLVPDLDIFNTAVEVRKRETGSWIQWNELASLFNKFCILHNPDFYKSNIKLSHNYNYYNDNPFEINMEIDCVMIYPTEALNSDPLIASIVDPLYEKLQTPSNKQKVALTSKPNQVKQKQPPPKVLRKNSSYFYDYFKGENWNNIKYSFDTTEDSNSCVLIQFEANYRAKYDFIPISYYIVLDLVSIDRSIIKRNIVLTSFSNSYQHDNLNPKETYFLLVKGGIFPYGFHLSLFTDSNVASLSSFKLYKEVFSTPSHSFSIEPAVAEGKKYTLLLKLKIRSIIENMNENEVNVSIRDKATFKHEEESENNDLLIMSKPVDFKFSIDYKNIYLKQFLKLELVEEEEIANINDFSLHPLEDMAEPSVVGDKEMGTEYNYKIESEKQRKSQSKRVYFNNIITVSCSANKDIYLVLGIIPPINTEINEMTFTIFSSLVVQATRIEIPESFEINEKYYPNKNRILFSEMIYSSERTFASFEIKVNKSINTLSTAINNTSLSTAMQTFNIRKGDNPLSSATTRKTAHPSSAKSEVAHYNENKADINDSGDLVKMNLKIIRDNKILSSYSFHNSIIISHLMMFGCILVPDKKAQKGSKQPAPINQENLPYLIVCTFDCNELDYDLIVSYMIK